ncbi:MAG: orotidine-5'-phosphate decarboxylase [Bacteroidales bacterium]|jgi:orotidine-5'-phosphate decarboxylase|nr:orotidine-5'-phosphate decarboxylase [Bacteroidales bacterium]
MNRKTLIDRIKQKRSFLCIGLDSELDKIPEHLLKYEDPVYEFNKRIIDATHDLAVAYKPNLAFYEYRGIAGLTSLKKTMQYLAGKIPELFTIADAKRGDIGNTSKQYAQAFLGDEPAFNFDAITVAPYMGEDSVSPFLSFDGKWVILLALTSNKGAFDYQFLVNRENGKRFFEEVLERSQRYGNNENMMYVVGATQAEMFEDVRKIVPDHFLLVPGVGAQGGSLEAVCKYGLNKDCGLLVNSSRGIIFASKGEDFAEAARMEALKLQQQMESILKGNNIL